MDPNFSEAYYHKGLLLFELKEYKKSYNTFKQFVEVDPSDEAYFNLGNSLFKLKRYLQAKEAYKVAITKNQNHEKAKRNMIMCDRIIQQDDFSL